MNRSVIHRNVLCFFALCSAAPPRAKHTSRQNTSGGAFLPTSFRWRTDTAACSITRSHTPGVSSRILSRWMHPCSNTRFTHSFSMAPSRAIISSATGRSLPHAHTSGEPRRAYATSMDWSVTFLFATASS